MMSEWLCTSKMPEDGNWYLVCYQKKLHTVTAARVLGKSNNSRILFEDRTGKVNISSVGFTHFIDHKPNELTDKVNE